MNYAEFVTRLAYELKVHQTDFGYTVAIPTIIDIAEQRIYREIDLLNTVTRQTGTLTVGTRTFNLPTASGRFVVTNGFNVITPSSTTVPDNGTRVPLVPVSRDVLDVFWPSTTGAGVPAQYAMITDQQIVVGPAPSAAYTIECIGTIRPTPLSAQNTSTYLTLYLPDLFMAAAVSAGAKEILSADPKGAALIEVSEAEYQRLFASAGVEEQRKRYAAGAWGSLSPTPLATPNR